MKDFRIGGLVKIKKQKVEGIFEDIPFIFNAISGKDDWNAPGSATRILNEELMDGFLRDLELFYPVSAWSDKQEKYFYTENEFTRGLTFSESQQFSKLAEENLALVIEGPILKKAPDIYYKMYPDWKKTDPDIKLYKILLGKNLYWVGDCNLSEPDQVFF